MITICHKIYIPLCFYFIFASQQPFLQSHQFTFHYASTLSYWIFFYRLILYIYIPLCFYFIRNGRPHYHMILLNLHSTMLLLYRATPLVRILFAHIYIPLCFYFIMTLTFTVHPGTFYLHSTMLLLYPVRRNDIFSRG